MPKEIAEIKSLMDQNIGEKLLSPSNSVVTRSVRAEAS